MLVTKSEFKYAVGGITPTTFPAGTPHDKLPPDVAAWAESQGMLTDDNGEGKAVERSPENKDATRGGAKKKR